MQRQGEAWKWEINQLKYACKQLHRETSGIALKFNAGAEFIFHETVGSTGVANFVHFYKRCSPANQECMRAVSIIELEMNVDHADRDIPMPAMSIANNYSPLPYERFPDAGPKEVRRFNRREPMLIGRAGEASLLLYNICRLTPTLHVVLRYTDRDGTASWDWIQETYAWRIALGREGEPRPVPSFSAMELWATFAQGAQMHRRMQRGTCLANLRMSVSTEFWVGDEYVPVFRGPALVQRERIEEARGGLRGGYERGFRVLSMRHMSARSWC